MQNRLWGRSHGGRRGAHGLKLAGARAQKLAEAGEVLPRLRHRARPRRDNRSKPASIASSTPRRTSTARRDGRDRHPVQDARPSSSTGPDDADPWGREALYDGETRVGRTDLRRLVGGVRQVDRLGEVTPRKGRAPAGNSWVEEEEGLCAAESEGRHNTTKSAREPPENGYPPGAGVGSPSPRAGARPACRARRPCPNPTIAGMGAPKSADQAGSNRDQT